MLGSENLKLTGPADDIACLRSVAVAAALNDFITLIRN